MVTGEGEDRQKDCSSGAGAGVDANVNECGCGQGISAVARFTLVWEYNRGPLCAYIVRSKLKPLLECTALYSGCTVANYPEIAIKLPLFSLPMHVVHNPQRNTSTGLYNNAVQQYTSVFQCTETPLRKSPRFDGFDQSMTVVF